MLDDGLVRGVLKPTHYEDDHRVGGHEEVIIADRILIQKIHIFPLGLFTKHMKQPITLKI